MSNTKTMTTFERECLIKEYTDWRAPYIGRVPAGNFWDVFKKVYDDNHNYVVAGVYIFESTTEEPNPYDIETSTHSLTVYFNTKTDSLNRGLINKIVGAVYTHFYTSSNWHDIKESKHSAHCVKTPEAIESYKKLLDACTNETGEDYVLNLFRHIKASSQDFKEEPIYKLKDGNGWSFYGVGSRELCKYLRYARSYLEFFFAIHYLAELRDFFDVFDLQCFHFNKKDCESYIFKKEEFDKSYISSRSKALKAHLDKVETLLGYINLRFFYDGFDDCDYSLLKWLSVERLEIRSGIARHLFGLPNKVITASINAAIEEMQAKGRRDYRNAFLQDTEFSFNDYGVDVRAISAIPLGSYFFFSDVMGYLGYAREDGSVYIKESKGGHKFIGTMEDDGSVFNASGVSVCRIEDNLGVCRAKRYHEDRHGKYYGIWMDENGQIFGDTAQGEVRYLGEAYVWEQEIDFESYRDDANPYIKLTRIKKGANNSCDKRLGGIALLGYLPINEILDIADKCNKSK